MDESMNNSHFMQVQGLSLIDVSSEDDCLIFNSSNDEPYLHQSSEYPELSDFEALETMDADKVQGTECTFENKELVPQPFESLGPERTRKNGKYNLRKSLAWDSAFFTCEGVLEPEELTCIIEGAENDEKQLLPVIEEDVHRSTDSISTLQSENLTQECLETELFEDIRASIQKSSKLSNIANSSSKAGSGLKETQTIRSSKLDVSQSKIKPKPTSKKPSVVMQGSGKTTKHVSTFPQSVPTSRESAPSLPKPPKVVARVSPISTISTKRASLGYNRVKKEMDNAKGNVAAVAKIPTLAGSRSKLPRAMPPTKASSLGSTATNIERPTSRSSVESCGSASSDSNFRSPFNHIKKKMDCRIVSPPSSGSSHKVSSKNKVQSGKSGISAYAMSTNKLSSNISPASSISEWSSESSSSTIVTKISASSRYASSCEGISVDSDTSQILHSQTHFSDNSSGGRGSQVIQKQDQCGKRASKGTSSILCPSFAQPSGLRMPSPKIGFFDGVKSLVRTPNGSTQLHSGVPSGLPKSGAGGVSPSGGSNKAKLAKSQPVRTVTTGGNRKPDSQKTAMSVKSVSPIPLQEPSIASVKVSSASRNVKNYSGKSPKVQNKMTSKTSGDIHLKAEAVGTKGLDLVKEDQELVLIAERNDSLGLLKDEVRPEVNNSAYDINIPPINEEDTNNSSIANIDNLTPSVKVSEDSHLKNDKRNTHYEDQLDGLSRNIGALETNVPMQKEQLISDSISQSQCDFICQEPEFSLIAEKNRSLGFIKDDVDPEIKVVVNSICASKKVREEAHLKNDLLFCDTNEKENTCYENPIDGVCRNMEASDIHVQMQKMHLSDSLSLPRICNLEDAYQDSDT